MMRPVKVNSTSTVCVDIFEIGIELFNSSSKQWQAYPFNLVLPQGAIPRAVVPKLNQRPHAYLSADQARSACNNAGKRICMRNEFLAACQGPKGFTYPYGNDFQQGYCNTGNANPVITLFGPDPTWSEEEMNDPRLGESTVFLKRSLYLASP